MKILFDHQAFNLQAFGGVSRYFCEMAGRIPALAGDEVEIMAPLHINHYLAEHASLRVRGFRVPAFTGTNLLRRSLAAALVKAMAFRRRDAGIFHETFFSKADFSPASARRVVTVFDMIHEKFISGQAAARRTIAAKTHAVRRADHVICISESTRRDLIELTGLDPGKTSVVHLGFSLMPGGHGGTVPPPIASPYLLYVGARGGYKNFGALLSAFARSAMLKEEYSLVCLGGGRFSGPELERMNSLGIRRDRVTQVSGDDAMLARMYSGATALIYPSLYEGFGIPPLEAMSFGCPVICSNASSLPEVVGEAAALFDPADPEHMRELIEQVVTSPAMLGRLVSLGQERIKLFSWDKCARETLDVYRHVLGR